MEQPAADQDLPHEQRQDRGDQEPQADHRHVEAQGDRVAQDPRPGRDRAEHPAPEHDHGDEDERHAPDDQAHVIGGARVGGQHRLPRGDVGGSVGVRRRGGVAVAEDQHLDRRVRREVHDDRHQAGHGGQGHHRLAEPPEGGVQGEQDGDQQQPGTHVHEVEVQQATERVVLEPGEPLGDRRIGRRWRPGDEDHHRDRDQRGSDQSRPTADPVERPPAEVGGVFGRPRSVADPGTARSRDRRPAGHCRLHHRPASSLWHATGDTVPPRLLKRSVGPLDDAAKGRTDRPSWVIGRVRVASS